MEPAKRTRKDATPPPPAPKGDDNPSSYKSLQSRVKELEAENEHLKSKLDQLTAALADERTGEDEGISASRMRKVMNQRPEADAGPLEERIREWLTRDVKGFDAAMEEKEERTAGHAAMAERNKALESRITSLMESTTSAGPDGGAAAARELIERCLADALTVK